jgi:hypothetical protein
MGAKLTKGSQRVKHNEYTIVDTKGGHRTVTDSATFTLRLNDVECYIKKYTVPSNYSADMNIYMYYLYVNDVPDNMVAQFKVAYEHYNKIFHYGDVDEIDFKHIRGPLKQSKHSGKYKLRLKFEPEVNVFSGIDYTGNVEDLLDSVLFAKEIMFTIKMDDKLFDIHAMKDNLLCVHL